MKDQLGKQIRKCHKKDKDNEKMPKIQYCKTNWKNK